MLAVLCAWFDLSPEGRCRSGSETPKVSRVNRASGLGPASVLFPMAEKRPAGGQGVGSRLLVIDSGAFEAFRRRAAEPQAEAELIGCALTRLGQDERAAARSPSRIPRERNFVKTFGPKYGNACLPLWSRAGASCAGRYTNPEPA